MACDHDSVACDLHDLVEAMPDGMAHYRPAQRYALVDQRRLDPALLSGSTSILANLFRMELSDWPDVVKEVLPLLVTWLRQDEMEPARHAVALWLQQRFAREAASASQVLRLPR